jgi:hypothetical protein
LKAKKLITIVAWLSTIGTVAFGSAELNRAEILQVFQALTTQPRNTWIPAGIIEATHMEYKASSGYTTDSNTTVKYDGNKFYWEININSYTKEAEHQGPSSEKIDMNWNKRRVFVWDGQNYTMYFRPSNRVMVTENPSIPVKVNGPLTAGIVPWGYGMYTLEELSIAEFSGEIDEQGVHITLNKTNRPTITIVLDPAKDYAVLSCSINSSGLSSIEKTYGGYELVSGKWLPTTILIEGYDNSKQEPELLTLDYWTINYISTTAPEANSFAVEYEGDALVEYRPEVSGKPLFYRHYSEVDTGSLLRDRIEILTAASADDTPAQNCATAAMKYVSRRLGKNITNTQLAELVNDPNQGTSLHKLRQFAQGLGFYCLAAKTDITTLKDLSGCQAILHLPGTDHFIVFEYFDDEYVWVVDLDNNNFFYRTRLDLFNQEWSEGTALLISNTSLNNLQGNLPELGDHQLHEIIGGFPNYSCTKLIQAGKVIWCSDRIGVYCPGRYTKFEELCGCEEDPNGGTCIGYDLPGIYWSLCVISPEWGECTDSGAYYAQYIRACPCPE